MLLNPSLLAKLPELRPSHFGSSLSINPAISCARFLSTFAVGGRHDNTANTATARPRFFSIPVWNSAPILASSGVEYPPVGRVSTCTPARQAARDEAPLG